MNLLTALGMNHTSELNITYLFENQKTLGSRVIYILFGSLFVIHFFK